MDRTQGYNLLNQFYIKYDANDNELYIFNQTFGYAFKKIYASNYQLKIVMPPGATDINARLPLTLRSIYHLRLRSWRKAIDHTSILRSGR